MVWGYVSYQNRRQNSVCELLTEKWRIVAATSQVCGFTDVDSIHVYWAKILFISLHSNEYVHTEIKELIEITTEPINLNMKNKQNLLTYVYDCVNTDNKASITSKKLD
jgi:hypothetical protein